MDIWSCSTAQEVAGALATDPDAGLSEKEAKRRRKDSGAVFSSWGRRASALAALSAGHAGVFLPFLMLVCSVILLMNRQITAGVSVGIALIFNVAALLSAYARALAVAEDHALRAYPSARVLREGKKRLVAAWDVVKGDVIIFGRGDFIPFDCKLISSENFTVLETPDEKAGEEKSAFEKYGIGKPKGKKEKARTSKSVLSKKSASGEGSVGRQTVVRAGSVAVSGFATAVVCELSSGLALISARKKRAVDSLFSIPEVRRAKTVSGIFSAVLAAYVLIFSLICFIPGIEGDFIGSFILLCACAGASGAEFIAAFSVISAGGAFYRALHSSYCGSAVLPGAETHSLCCANFFILPLCSVFSEESFRLSYAVDSKGCEHRLIGSDYLSSGGDSPGALPLQALPLVKNALLACGRADSLAFFPISASNEGDFTDCDYALVEELAGLWERARGKSGRGSFKDFCGVTGHVRSAGVFLSSVYTPHGSYAAAFGRLDAVLPLCGYSRIGAPGLEGDELKRSILALAAGTSAPFRVYAVATSRCHRAYEPDENGRVSGEKLRYNVLASCRGRELSHICEEGPAEQKGHEGTSPSLVLEGLLVCEGEFSPGSREILFGQESGVQLILRAKDGEQRGNAKRFFGKCRELSAEKMRSMSDDELVRELPGLNVISGFDSSGELKLIAAAESLPASRGRVCYGGEDISDIVCMNAADSSVFFSSRQAEGGQRPSRLRPAGEKSTPDAARLACGLLVPSASGAVKAPFKTASEGSPPEAGPRPEYIHSAFRGGKEHGGHGGEMSTPGTGESASGESVVKKAGRAGRKSGRTALPYDSEACAGGLNSLLAARRRLLGIAGSSGRTICYLAAATAAKAVFPLLSVFGAPSLLNAVFIALFGLIFDFAVCAVLSAAPVSRRRPQGGGDGTSGGENKGRVGVFERAEKSDPEHSEELQRAEGEIPGANTAGRGENTQAAPRVKQGAKNKNASEGKSLASKGLTARGLTSGPVAFAVLGLVFGALISAAGVGLSLLFPSALAGLLSQIAVAVFSFACALYLYFAPAR